MAMRDYIIPDEVQSASTAAAGMLSVVTKTSHFWIKQAFAAALPLAAGAAFGFWLSNALTEKTLEDFKDIVASIITLSTVLAGFIVTLMLFTGRTSGATSLPLDSMEAYSEKVKYLLFSQVFTLAVHLLVAIGCVGWLLANAICSQSKIPDILLCITSGLLCLSLIRTMLLPFQIYEIHEFELDSIVIEKRNQILDSLNED